MKKFGKLKLFGLGIVLTIALVFMAINFLEAKKPPRWEWEVYIPGKGEDVNLYAYEAGGFPSGNLFTDTDPIFVRVKRSRRTLYSFRFWIEKDRDNLEKIGFYGLDLVPNDDLKPSGKGPCSFPDYGPCPPQGTYQAPDCMELFLENYPHPYTDPDPDYDYEVFWLSVDVDCDIESMDPDETLFPSGNVYIDIGKSDSVLTTGCEDLHSIVVNRDVDEGSGIIKITKLSKDSWEIKVETADDTMRFTEAYWGYRGKGKGKFVTKKPIRAKAPFKFITTWTRY